MISRATFDSTDALFSLDERRLPVTRLLLLQRPLAALGCSYLVGATDMGDMVLCAVQESHIRTLLLEADGQTTLCLSAAGRQVDYDWSVEEFDEQRIGQLWAAGAYGTGLN